MTGWIIAGGLAIVLMTGLVALGRIPRTAREITAAALLLGLAGYAWQGNPALGGAPKVAGTGKAGQFDEQLAEQRRGMAERYGKAGQWLLLSDGLGRQGKTKEAANVLLAGLKQSLTMPTSGLALAMRWLLMPTASCRRAPILPIGGPCRLIRMRLRPAIFTVWHWRGQGSCKRQESFGALWRRARRRGRISKRNWNSASRVSTRCWLQVRSRLREAAWDQLRCSNRHDRARPFRGASGKSCRLPWFKCRTIMTIRLFLHD